MIMKEVVSIAALTAALACAAAVFVLALPSGNVVHSKAAGYYSLDLMSGYSQIAEPYTTGLEDMWSGGAATSTQSWGDEEEGVINAAVHATVKAQKDSHSGARRKLLGLMKKTTVATSASYAFTISAWVYISSTSGDFALFTFGPENECNGENGLGFYTWTGPMLLSMTSCNMDGSQGTSTVLDGWHHVAVSHDAANSPPTVAYLDGQVEFTSTYTLEFNPEIAFIGARTADTSSNWPLKNANGNFYMDDLRVWSRALTAAEVQFDVHGGAALLGLIGNYDGSVTAAGKLQDLAEGNDATRQGVAATYTTTAICPLAIYVSSCGTLACRYVLDNATIPMCGPCLAGYHSAILANLSANCALDIPNPPTSPSTSVSGSGCLLVTASPPLVSAAITSYSVKYGSRSTTVTVASSSATMSTTVCGLTSGKTYTFYIRATNAAGTGAAVSITGVPVSSTSSTCKVGYYLNGSTCTKCSAGTYSGVAGATACTSCGIGKYSSAAGRSTCSACPIGHYGDATALTYCHSCARGRFGAAAGVSVCGRCVAGTYSGVIAQTVCDLCTAGSYQPNAGRSVCLTCSKSSATTAGASTCA